MEESRRKKAMKKMQIEQIRNITYILYTILGLGNSNTQKTP